MLDRTALPQDARAYFDKLPKSTQLSIQHSNLYFYSLEDLKSYDVNSVGETNAVLYQKLPEPSIPSNAALDAIDTE